MDAALRFVETGIGLVIEPPVKAREFDPALHPHGEGGRFTETGGSDGGDNEAAVSRHEVTPDKYQTERLIKDGSKEGMSKSGIVKDPNLGIWGASHSGSSIITGHSAIRMGIAGYEDYEASKESRNLGDKFLRVIASSGGVNEPLYHGFNNTAGTQWKVGDTLSLPLLATAGDISDSAGYAFYGQDVGDPNAPTVFEFPVGTPYAGYSRWDREQSKAFGYQWGEAIVAGKFEITGIRTANDPFFPPGSSRSGDYTVVTLKPLAVFDPELEKWHDR
jgi:hypothetical protein